MTSPERAPEEGPRSGLGRWPTATFLLGFATLFEGLMWPGVHYGTVTGSLDLIAPILFGWLVIFVTFLVVLFVEVRGALVDQRQRARGEETPERGRGSVLAMLAVVLALNVLFVALWAK